MNVTALLLLLLGFFYFTSAGMGFIAFLCLLALILVVLSSAFSGGSGPQASTKKGGSNAGLEGMGSAFGKIINWFGKTLGSLFLGGGKKDDKKDEPQVIELVHRKR